MPPAPPISGEGLVTRRLRVSNDEVVLLRAILEGYDGLAALYGDGSGVVALSTPTCRAAELDDLIDALRAELTLTPLD